MKKILFLLVLVVSITLGYSQPSLDLTSPNGGEVWQSGSSYNITWTCSGCGPTVDINLSVNGGMSWNPIVTGAPNTGSYTWNIP
ncbi:MAG: GPI anchored serine-threonine rich family protein, partial [Flavobacteriales bacterium]|nr:GPI anchored serine-threonine rich family protein [Flavobacteriales bacterium]